MRHRATNIYTSDYAQVTTFYLLLMTDDTTVGQPRDAKGVDKRRKPVRLGQSVRVDRNHRGNVRKYVADAATHQKQNASSA